MTTNQFSSGNWKKVQSNALYSANAQPGLGSAGLFKGKRVAAEKSVHEGGLLL